MKKDLAINRTNRIWENGMAQSITFIVTEDCQLRCKYCYIVGKNNKKKMSLDTAKKAIEYILGNRDWFSATGVTWDFIGGEPLLEIELLDNIMDYIKRRLYELNHPWFDCYRINISTNGLMYDNPRVQRFITKNLKHLNIGISVDGTRLKHDMQRVYPNGRGSYDDIIKNIPLWISQFPESSTKVTIAHDDLPYICESVLHLWEIGIKEVNINVIFEDEWQDKDDIVYEEQLRLLADNIIEKRLFYDNRCSFFQTSIGKPLDPINDTSPWCGAGRMLAIGTDGNFYPCVRFAPFSLTNREAIVIGNCETGIDTDRCRPFHSNCRVVYNPKECMECEVASGCADCQGVNYDNADTDTIFQKATYICKMHKARVRANAYFEEQLQALLTEIE